MTLLTFKENALCKLKYICILKMFWKTGITFKVKYLQTLREFKDDDMRVSFQGTLSYIITEF